MPKEIIYKYVKSYYRNKSFERIIIKNTKNEIIKIIIKVNNNDVIDAFDFVD